MEPEHLVVVGLLPGHVDRLQFLADIHQLLMRARFRFKR
jgi:hypothetical protein